LNDSEVLVFASGDTEVAGVGVGDTVGTANGSVVSRADGGAVFSRSAFTGRGLDNSQGLVFASGDTEVAGVGVGDTVGTANGSVVGRADGGAVFSRSAFTGRGLDNSQGLVLASGDTEVAGVGVSDTVGTANGGVVGRADGGAVVNGSAFTGGGLGNSQVLVLASGDPKLASVGVGDTVGTANGCVDGGAGGGAFRLAFTFSEHGETLVGALSVFEFARVAVGLFVGTTDRLVFPGASGLARGLLGATAGERGSSREGGKSQDGRDDERDLHFLMRRGWLVKRG
jgi:hypothetical protein